jgi:hypothetical protein
MDAAVSAASSSSSLVVTPLYTPTATFWATSTLCVEVADEREPGNGQREDEARGRGGSSGGEASMGEQRTRARARAPGEALEGAPSGAPERGVAPGIF